MSVPEVAAARPRSGWVQVLRLAVSAGLLAFLITKIDFADMVPQNRSLPGTLAFLVAGVVLMGFSLVLAAWASAIGAGIADSARRIDAPTLACSIARPDKPDRTFVGRRGAEMSDLDFARNPAVADVVEPHPVENVLPGRQALQQQFCGEVVIARRVR